MIYNQQKNIGFTYGICKLSAGKQISYMDPIGDEILHHSAKPMICWGLEHRRMGVPGVPLFFSAGNSGLDGWCNSPKDSM